MGKNKYLDLFTDIMPSVDAGFKELWDAEGVDDNGRKEITGDLWNLVRFISSVSIDDRETQEHFLLTVNEFYNKNWNTIRKHPKLQWQSLCACAHESKKQFYHEYIPLKKQKDKKTEFLATLFPNMKMADVETLSAINTNKDIKVYCESLGWDKKAINEIKL